LTAQLCGSTKFARDKIIFLDAGFYILTSTLFVPPGTRLVGEAWSVLAGKGKIFADQRNPQVVVRVGEREAEHEGGRSVEITDVLFTTVGPAAGAIVVEWNVGSVDSGEPPGGLWDSHIRCVSEILMVLDAYSILMTFTSRRLAGSKADSIIFLDVF
jgi:hypothetical protein